MSSLSFVSNDDSTSICAADVSLDMPPVAARYIPCGNWICLPDGKTRLGERRGSRIAALVAQSATYRLLATRANIEFERSENISSCEATYRSKERILANDRR